MNKPDGYKILESAAELEKYARSNSLGATMGEGLLANAIMAAGMYVCYGLVRLAEPLEELVALAKKSEEM